MALGAVSLEHTEQTFETATGAREAVDRLCELYETSVGNLRAALKTYLDGGAAPSEGDRAAGAFAYPELRVTYLPEGPVPPVSRAFGKFSEAGVYAQTVTHPAAFRRYLEEQIETARRRVSGENRDRIVGSGNPVLLCARRR